MLFLGRGHLLRCRSALQRIDERPGMSEALPRSVTSEVCREWDGHLLRTSYLRPQDSVAVLISYRLDPWPVDSGMPPIVAEVFGRTLPRFGMIAGRWLGRALPHGELQFLPVNHPLLRRIVWRLTGQWLADLVLTRSPATTIDLAPPVPPNPAAHSKRSVATCRVAH
jgi:hypothetical protein